MAELVQANEEASVELYKGLAKSKLLNERELELLTKKRRHFETEIRKAGSQAEQEYIAFITYDMGVLEMIKKRKKIAEENLTLSHRHIEKSNAVILMFGSNINHLFKELLKRFGKNLENWAMYLDFCRNVKTHHLADALLEKLVKTHSDKPLAFAYAAEWVFRRSGNHELARTYLVQGLRLHEDNQYLYLELVKLELNFMKMLKAKYDNQENMELTDDVMRLTDDVMQGVICKLVFKFARTNIPLNSQTVLFYKQILDQYRAYDFTREMQQELIDDILTELPSNEMFQDLRARLHLVHKLTDAGIPYPMEEITACFDAYRAILESVNTELMWSYVVDWTTNILHETTSRTESEEIKKWYLKLFNDGHEKDKLGAKQYVQWFQILYEDQKIDLLAQLRNTVMSHRRLSKSPELWLDLLKYHISEGADAKKVYDVFQEGVKTLEDKSLQLFLFTISYFNSQLRSKVSEIYEQGVNLTQYPALCTRLRVMYLEWLAVDQNRNKCRQFYRKYRSLAPFSLELHETIYKVELASGKLSEQNKSHMTEIRDLACIQFGQDNVDVWIDALRHDFELREGKNADDISRKARKYLENSNPLLIQFEQKFFDLKAEYANKRYSETYEELRVGGSQSRVGGQSVHSQDSLHSTFYFRKVGAESIRTVDSNDC